MLPLQHMFSCGPHSPERGLESPTLHRIEPALEEGMAW